MKNIKVFVIGFHKTGTTSMGIALKKLGYRVTGPNGIDDPQIEENVLPMAYNLVENYDAFQDNPWPIIFQKIDEKYPGSKFILTIRNPDLWIKSAVAHFGQRETPMRRWIYGKGCPQGNEEIYLKRYTNHNASVLKYFKNRPNDLLVLDLSEDDVWKKLCLFLGHNVPKEAFPHANRSISR